MKMRYRRRSDGLRNKSSRLREGGESEVQNKPERKKNKTKRKERQGGRQHLAVNRHI